MWGGSAGGGCSGCWLGGAKPSVYDTAGDVLCPQCRVSKANLLPSDPRSSREVYAALSGRKQDSVSALGGLRAQHGRGSQPWPVCCLQRAPRAGKSHLRLCSINCSGSWLPLGLDRGPPALGLPLSITCRPGLLLDRPCSCLNSWLDAVSLTFLVPGFCDPLPSEAVVSFEETALQLCPGGAGGLVWGQFGLLSVRVRVCSPLGWGRL